MISDNMQMQQLSQRAFKLTKKTRKCFGGDAVAEHVALEWREIRLAGGRNNFAMTHRRFATIVFEG